MTLPMTPTSVDRYTSQATSSFFAPSSVTAPSTVAAAEDWHSYGSSCCCCYKSYSRKPRPRTCCCRRYPAPPHCRCCRLPWPPTRPWWWTPSNSCRYCENSSVACHAHASLLSLNLRNNIPCLSPNITFFICVSHHLNAQVKIIWSGGDDGIFIAPCCQII